MYLLCFLEYRPAVLEKINGFFVKRERKVMPTVANPFFKFCFPVANNMNMAVVCKMNRQSANDTGCKGFKTVCAEMA
jgi:hypothetical protein